MMSEVRTTQIRVEDSTIDFITMICVDGGGENELYPEKKSYLRAEVSVFICRNGRAAVYV